MTFLLEICVRHTFFTALVTILDIYISFLQIPVSYVISNINTEDCQSSTVYMFIDISIILRYIQYYNLIVVSIVTHI